MAGTNQIAAELVALGVEHGAAAEKARWRHPSQDQGSQHTRVAFGERCKKMGVRSMGTVGDAYDNAMAESFFATLECELIDRRSRVTGSHASFDKTD